MKKERKKKSVTCAALFSSFVQFKRWLFCCFFNYYYLCVYFGCEIFRQCYPHTYIFGWWSMFYVYIWHTVYTECIYNMCMLFFFFEKMRACVCKSTQWCSSAVCYNQSPLFSLYIIEKKALSLYSLYSHTYSTSSFLMSPLPELAPQFIYPSIPPPPGLYSFFCV